MKRLTTIIAVFALLVAGFGVGDAVASPAPKKSRKKTQVDPLRAQSLMREAYVFMQQDRFEEAIAKFREADTANPGNATVYNMIGLCYLSLEQFDEALKQFDLALQIIPGFSDARNNRGSTYLALRQFRMAEVDFIAVLSDSTYPHRLKVYYNLGVTYLSRGQIGAAEENFNNAISGKPPVFEAYLRLAEIAQMKDETDSALALIEEARLKFPERIEGSLAYGRLLIDAQRPDEARPYLEDVIESDPASPMAKEARELLGES